ncbi:MAG: tRNA (cytidine(34)-2'-O)-methyltransferase [Verrucomicrobiae bacterium]|nr:tRNA (cytidine(34)-2'-O)-methyltransferase [Verrucomicrobiae bacterium]
MNVVLVEPEIPPNTGNVARLCAATNSTLHLIGPLGFRLDDRQLKRAGMDYWEHVTWKYWKSWDEFRPATAQFWLVENKTDRLYTAVTYRPDDYLVFGRETAGLPAKLLEEHRDSVIAIPQYNPAVRSLNLANCVAIVLYEALRQVKGF